MWKNGKRESLWKMLTHKKRENSLKSVWNRSSFRLDGYYAGSLIPRLCAMTVFSLSLPKLKLIFMAIHWNAKEYHNTHPMTESIVPTVPDNYISQHKWNNFHWITYPFHIETKIQSNSFHSGLRYGIQTERTQMEEKKTDSTKWIK